MDIDCYVDNINKNIIYNNLNDIFSSPVYRLRWSENNFSLNISKYDDDLMSNYDKTYFLSWPAIVFAWWFVNMTIQFYGDNGPDA